MTEQFEPAAPRRHLMVQLIDVIVALVSTVGWTGAAIAAMPMHDVLSGIAFVVCLLLALISGVLSVTGLVIWLARRRSQ